MDNSFVRSVWVSYSGADQDLVQDLANYVDENYCRAKVQCENFKPFRLMTYKRTSAFDIDPLYGSEPEHSQKGESDKIGTFYYLRPGESVGELVEVIASNLRRVVVISPDYLASKHCLWELCSCLTRQDGGALFVLLHQFNGLSEIKASRKYLYLGSEEFSLAQALALTYKKWIKNSMPDVFYLAPHQEESLEEYFTTLLDGMSDRLYVTGKERIDHLGALLSAYVDKMSSTETVLRQYKQFYKEQFDHWQKSQFTKHCCEALKQESFKFSHLETLDMGKIGELVNFMYESFAGREDEKEAICVDLRKLSGLLALRMIDPEWAAEMRMSSLSGLRIRLSSVSGDVISEPKFYCQVAAHAIQQVGLELEPDGSYSARPTGLFQLSPLVGANEQREIDMKKRKDAILLELVAKVMGLSDIHAKKFMQKPRWQVHFRSRARNRTMIKDGALTVARFYVDRSEFGMSLDARWQDMVDQLVQEINFDVGNENKITVGVLMMTGRDEGNLVQFIQNDNQEFIDLQDQILMLMEKCQ